jgi:hypothetical protein
VTGVLKKTGLNRTDTLVVIPLAGAQAAFGLEDWISALLLTAREGSIDRLESSLATMYPELEINTQDRIRAVL